MLLENNIKVFFHIYNFESCKDIVDDILNFFNDDLLQKIEYCHNNEELDTLNRLYEFSKSNDCYKILYIHTKGAVNRNSNVDSWRRYMCRYLIGGYKNCLEKLNEYDACGVDFRNDPQQHFSGNFWWVNSSYINTLKYPDDTFSSLTPRHKSEFWVGSKSPNVCSLNDCGVSVYDRHLYNYDKF